MSGGHGVTKVQHGFYDPYVQGNIPGNTPPHAGQTRFRPRRKLLYNHPGTSVPPESVRPPSEAAMPTTIKRIRIFVASPGDVADERKRLDEIVAHLRTHVAAPHGLDLELVRWETHVRPGVAADAQAVVNPQIGAYDLFIGILWNRFGTPTGRAESGTREEFDQAYARWQRDPGSLELWMYFSEQPAAFATMAELEQKGKVLAFRQELQTKKGALTWAYRDPADFEAQVRGHLELFIAKQTAPAPSDDDTCSRPSWLDILRPRAFAGQAGAPLQQGRATQLVLRSGRGVRRPASRHEDRPGTGSRRVHGSHRPPGRVDRSLSPTAAQGAVG